MKSIERERGRDIKDLIGKEAGQYQNLYRKGQGQYGIDRETGKAKRELTLKGGCQIKSGRERSRAKT